MGKSTPTVPRGGLQCIQQRELLESKLEFASAGNVWRASGSGRSARHAVRVAVRVLSFVVGLWSGHGEPCPITFLRQYSSQPNAREFGSSPLRSGSADVDPQPESSVPA